jgi:hypothetical protein
MIALKFVGLFVIASMAFGCGRRQTLLAVRDSGHKQLEYTTGTVG